MFSDGLALRIIVEGIMIGFLSLTAYIIGCNYCRNSSQLLGTTMCFAVLSLSQLFHAFNMRSRHSLLDIGIFSNWKLVVSFFLCSFLQIVVISVPFLSNIFKVTPLQLDQWIIVLFLSIVPIFVVELQKRSNKR
jgi:Ca2+-transporting ATPase